MSRLSRKLRPLVAAQAKHRCGYCQIQEVVSGIPLTVEHIHPLALGGNDEEDNLWLSCRLCNEAKGMLVDYPDPKTSTVIPLFNPRTQKWSEHFAWSVDNTKIIGKTAIGRATVAALSLNDEFRIRSRALWIEAGYHPPVD